MDSPRSWRSGLRGAHEARSFTAIAEWGHDLRPAVRMRLDLGKAPSESTIRRICRPSSADAVMIVRP